MTDLLAGATIKAADFPPTVSAIDSTVISNISSTSYITGTPEVGVTFTAPTSGRVLLTVSAGMEDNGAANRVHVAPQVYLGTSSAGTQVLAPDVTTRGVGCPAEATAFTYFSRTTLLDGLTPGSTYYARTQHKVSGGATGDIAVRAIMVEPTT